MIDVPAAFLPPPKRERKHFTDEALFEAPPPVEPLRRTRMTKLLAKRPDLEAKSWNALAERRRREKVAAAVAALLVGVARGS